MDERDFLAAVVPWDTGYVTIHWQRQRQKNFSGRSCQTIDDALTLIDELKERGDVDIYYCISTQKLGSGKRLRANAVALRAVPVDLDIDPNDPKKYPTVAAAFAALIEFCEQQKLPMPSFIVLSGGGMHAYWLSHIDLPVDDWQLFALALKATALAAGLKIDPTCTGDVVRVLRVPNTQNLKLIPKGGPARPVRLLQKYCNGNRYNFSVIFQAMIENAPEIRPSPHPETPIKVAEAFQHLDPKQGLGEGLVMPEIPPLPFEPIKAGCAWLRTAYETGGRDFNNTQWNYTTLCATWMEDGHELCHAFANQYPRYRYEQTEGEWERKNRERRDRNIGWPFCETIAATGTPHCQGCAHREKKKSPLTLGLDAVRPEVVDQEIAALGGQRPSNLRLPPDYCIDKEGWLCRYQPKRQVKKQWYSARLLRLISNTLRDPTLQYQNGRWGIGFVASTDRSGVADVFLGGTNIVRPGLQRALIEKGIRYNTEPEAMAFAEKFAMSWLDLLMKQDNAVRDPGTMGWRYEEGKRIGFVCGDKLYHENGDVIPLITAADDEFRSWYMPKGTCEAWLAAAKLLTDRKRPELDAIISIAFAAPLTVFAGTLYGAVLSIWGEPGTSKSTAQQVAAAVWGHPKQTRESLNSTAKSVQGRLGRTRNLPAYWDDVQDERHQEALFSTMFVAAEGAEGGRLNIDASYKQRLEWQTLLVACSNASFVEYLTKKQRSTTAGMRRVFEFEYNRVPREPGMINQLDASKTFAALEHNYGMIGAEYAKILAREHQSVEQLVASTINKFNAAVQGTNDESYWWGMCGVLLAGATLARRLGLDIDLVALERFLLAAYRNNREIRATEGTDGGSFDNTRLALTGFLNHYAGTGSIIFVERAFSHPSKVVSVIAYPREGQPIYIQVSRETRIIHISKRALRDWLEKHDIRTRQVYAGLVKHFAAIEVKLTMAAGTQHAKTQEQVIELLVPADSEILDQLVSAFGRADDSMSAMRQAPNGGARTSH